jgi:N-acetylglucosamine-6-phosphate deacetylase
LRRYVLRGATVVTPTRILRRGYVAVEGDRIVGVGGEPPRGFEGFDEVRLDGYVVGPGFVDTHTHGALGVDLSTASAGEVEELSRRLPRYGVTSYVPTAVTLPREALRSFCRSVASAGEVPGGARVVGVHLEGPYINPARAGAQNPAYARDASLEEFSELLTECGGLLRAVTVAPEVRGVRELIPYAVSRGVVVQVGHTNATYSEAEEAVALGASKATHLYNAMSTFHHRSPGAALALLRARDVYLELIVDFVHVAPEVVDFTIEYASYRRVVLVSDSISATGMPDGRYRLGDVEVEVAGGIARTVGTGALAGSTLTMDRAFANVVSLGYGLDEAFYMSSLAPALSLGLTWRLGIGALRPGFRADMVVVDPRDMGVAATIVGGAVGYVREDLKHLLT